MARLYKESSAGPEETLTGNTQLRLLSGSRDVVAIMLGRRLLEKLMRYWGLTLDSISEDELLKMLLYGSWKSLDDMYEAIGRGQFPASTIARRLALSTSAGSESKMK